MTHFKPSEIGITAEKARELGYDVQNDDDVVELRPQDVVIPRNCVENLFNTTKYLDTTRIDRHSHNPIPKSSGRFQPLTTLPECFE